MMKKNQGNGLAIMGGTFDPIHYGHLVTAETVRCHFGLDKIIFVPSGTPPHKDDREVTSAAHRYLMAHLAIATNPNFEISRIELERKGPSYTIDTISKFKDKYGYDVPMYFITGADAILEIMTWKQVEKLLTMCKFIAATRPGYDLNKVDKDLEQLNKNCLDNIHTISVPAMAISSTDIRERVRKGRTIKYLVPEAVEQYILKNELYS